VRLLVYLSIVGANEWFASVEGFNSESDMSPLELEKMHVRIFVVVATTIVAFLDNSMKEVSQDGTLTAKDVKDIFANMQPHQTVSQVAKIETASAPATTEITKTT